MRRNDVASTSFQRHVPTRFLINQCQIITFLILKSDIIENSRIELKGIILPVPSNQIKLHLLLFFPSTWYICDFFLFHIEIEGICGWIIGGGGPKGMLAPPLKLLGGLPPPAPPPFFLRLCFIIFAKDLSLPCFYTHRVERKTTNYCIHGKALIVTLAHRVQRKSTNYNIHGEALTDTVTCDFPQRHTLPRDIPRCEHGGPFVD